MGTSSKRLYLRLVADLGAEYGQMVQLKEGSNSLVCSARRLKDNKEFAIKVIDCRCLVDDEQEVLKLVRELKALQYFSKLGSPVIIHYEASFFSPAKEDCLLYIITEKMYGSFADVLDRRGHLSEEEAKCVFYEILLITGYEHSCFWVHRDRKPENLLFSLTPAALKKNYSLENLPPLTKENMREFFVFKDCDFGLARSIPNDHVVSTPTSITSPSPSPSSSSPSSPASLSSPSLALITPIKKKPTPTPAFLRHHSVFVATTTYKPLETLLREYDNVSYALIPSLTAIDMWANGVMLAEMLVGRVFPQVQFGMGNETECEIKSLLSAIPLNEQSKKIAQSFLKKRSPAIHLFNEIRCEESLYKRMENLHISAAAIDLVQKILDVDPAARLSAVEALNHPWFDSIRDADRQEKFFQSLPKELDRSIDSFQLDGKKSSVARLNQLLLRTVTGSITEPHRALPKRRRSPAKAPASPAAKRGTPSKSASLFTPTSKSPRSETNVFATPTTPTPARSPMSRLPLMSPPRRDTLVLRPGKIVKTKWGLCKLIQKFDDGWNALFFCNQRTLYIQSSEILPMSSSISVTSTTSTVITFATLSLSPSITPSITPVPISPASVTSSTTITPNGASSDPLAFTSSTSITTSALRTSSTSSSFIVQGVSSHSSSSPGPQVKHASSSSSSSAPIPGPVSLPFHPAPAPRGPLLPSLSLSPAVPDFALSTFFSTLPSSTYSLTSIPDYLDDQTLPDPLLPVSLAVIPKSTMTTTTTPITRDLHLPKVILPAVKSAKSFLSNLPESPRSAESKTPQPSESKRPSGSKRKSPDPVRPERPKKRQVAQISITTTRTITVKTKKPPRVTATNAAYHLRRPYNFRAR